MSLFSGTPGTPGLESRNCPETVPSRVPGLWELITPDCDVWSRRGLNQTCSPRRDLSNDISHTRFGGREEVDSRLLVVGSQIASLTPGPSFSHNLGYRCPNDQCEAIFYIYASRPFQWHQEHLNARCFGPCCRALNIQESRRATNPHFFQVLNFTPTLGQSRVATPKVSWIKEHTPTFPSYVVFTFERFKECGGVSSIILLWYFRYLINSLSNWKNIFVAQLINFPWSALEIIIVNLLLKYYTLSFW